MSITVNRRSSTSSGKAISSQARLTGITQHVAAYEVVRDKVDPSTSLRVNKRITFIDTPTMRRSPLYDSAAARAADIAILVVAADDGVKAQTLEALASIKEANIPFIVAINKIDKPNADVERAQRDPDGTGRVSGQARRRCAVAAISAKTGTGVDDLLDLILIVAELEGYKADASKLKRKGMSSKHTATKSAALPQRSLLRKAH